MYRFEKKATLVCAAASLITACCLPLSANVAFAQDSVEAQSIESKADFSSVVSDDLQPDNSSVIKDGWQRDESSGVWYYGKNGKHQTGWLQSGGYWYWLDPANDGAMQTGYFNVTDAGGSTASFYANDGNAATPFGALYQNCWLRNSDGNWFYANDGGDLAADWFYQDGTWYYLNPATHIMQVGFAVGSRIEIIPGSVNELPASDRNTIRAVIPIYSIFEPSIYEAIVAKNVGTSIDLVTTFEHSQRLRVKIIASPTYRLP